LCIYVYNLSHSVWRREQELRCTRGIHICIVYMHAHVHFVYMCMNVDMCTDFLIQFDGVSAQSARVVYRYVLCIHVHLFTCMHICILYICVCIYILHICIQIVSFNLMAWAPTPQSVWCIYCICVHLCIYMHMCMAYIYVHMYCVYMCIEFLIHSDVAKKPLCAWYQHTYFICMCNCVCACTCVLCIYMHIYIGYICVQRVVGFTCVCVSRLIHACDTTHTSILHRIRWFERLVT